MDYINVGCMDDCDDTLLSKGKQSTKDSYGAINHLIVSIINSIV